eukprot:Em0016g136a
MVSTIHYRDKARSGTRDIAWSGTRTKHSLEPATKHGLELRHYRDKAGPGTQALQGQAGSGTQHYRDKAGLESRHYRTKQGLEPRHYRDKGLEPGLELRGYAMVVNFGPHSRMSHGETAQHQQGQVISLRKLPGFPTCDNQYLISALEINFTIV